MPNTGYNKPAAIGMLSEGLKLVEAVSCMRNTCKKPLVGLPLSLCRSVALVYPD
jgi:hypothetical protein